MFKDTSTRGISNGSGNMILNGIKTPWSRPLPLVIEDADILFYVVMIIETLPFEEVLQLGLQLQQNLYSPK